MKIEDAEKVKEILLKTDNLTMSDVILQHDFSILVLEDRVKKLEEQIYKILNPKFGS